MKLKICGMKYNDNISLISKLNPDYMGLYFIINQKDFSIMNQYQGLIKILKR